MSEHTDGAVRVTQQRIYDLLLDTRDEVRAVRQSVEESLKPGLDHARADIRALREHKADKTELAKTDGRLSTVEYRVYAIVAGLITAFVGGKGLGFF